MQPEYGVFNWLEARSASRLTSLVTRAGGAWALAASDDGGATWRPIFPPLRPLDLPQFVDITYGFSADTPIAPGAFLATSDGGLTWEQRATLPIDGHTGLSFADRLNGCIFGRRWATGQPGWLDVWYETRDGGYTWAEGAAGGSCPPRGGWYYQVRAGDQRVTTSWGEALLPTTLKVEDGTITFVDASHGWSQIAGGRMYATTDGGRTWRQFV